MLWVVSVSNFFLLKVATCTCIYYVRHRHQCSGRTRDAYITFPHWTSKVSNNNDYDNNNHTIIRRKRSTGSYRYSHFLGPFYFLISSLALFLPFNDVFMYDICISMYMNGNWRLLLSSPLLLLVAFAPTAARFHFISAFHQKLLSQLGMTDSRCKYWRKRTMVVC